MFKIGDRVLVGTRAIPGTVVRYSDALRLAWVQFDDGASWDGDAGYLRALPR